MSELNTTAQNAGLSAHEKSKEDATSGTPLHPVVQNAVPYPAIVQPMRNNPIIHEPNLVIGNSIHHIPIMTQPASIMSPASTPPGLGVLAPLNKLLVKQKIEGWAEILLGCETNNKYSIKDETGMMVFTANEKTNCCTRMLCGRFRPFDVEVRDIQDRQVIHLKRPLACQSCWFPCCLQRITIFAPPDELVGSVHQQWSLCEPQFVVKNAEEETIFRIEGPWCGCGKRKFRILTSDGSTEVGQIRKKWSGLLKEAFTDVDNFGIVFPVDLDVKMKAVLLGACILIDFMYFED